MAGFAKSYLKDQFSKPPSPEGIIYVFGDAFPSVVLQITSGSKSQRTLQQISGSRVPINETAGEGGVKLQADGTR